MIGSLKRREKDFTIAGIITLTTGKDEENMNIKELQGKSLAELRDMYNKLADKTVKRFRNRDDAEKRVAEKLKEAGEWTGKLPGDSGKGKGKAAKKSAGKKSHTKDIPPRGQPRVNKQYIAVEHNRRMNEGSARTKVYNYVLDEGGKKGIDRETIENHFINDETINVKSSLDYLVKQGMMTAKDIK